MSSIYNNTYVYNLTTNTKLNLFKRDTALELQKYRKMKTIEFNFLLK